jgi:hypothetical protein
MTVRRKNRSAAMIIDLDGPEGNAFRLFALIRTLEGRVEGSKITERLMNKKYIDIIKYIDRHYSGVLVMETEQDYILEALGKE